MTWKAGLLALGFVLVTRCAVAAIPLESKFAPARWSVNDPHNLAKYPPPNSVPTGEDLWPSIYAWTGNGYTNVSSHYPQYYRTWLASLKKEIVKLDRERAHVAHESAAEIAHNRVLIGNGVVVTNNFFVQKEPEVAQSVSPQMEAAPAIDIDRLQAQAAKIERFLGSKNAGLLDAVRWANSKYPEERKLAAQVLADINTQEALKYEQALSHDADPDITKLANAKVKYWNEQNPYEAATLNARRPRIRHLAEATGPPNQSRDSRARRQSRLQDREQGNNKLEHLR